MESYTKYWILTDTHFGHAYLHDKCLRPVGFEEKILRQVRFHVDLRSRLLMVFTLIMMALTHGVNPRLGRRSAPLAESHYV